MSLGGWVCPEGGWVCRGGYVQRGSPYHVTYPMMHVMLTTLSPVISDQTDACGYITIPQLLLRAVINFHKREINSNSAASLLLITKYNVP